MSSYLRSRELRSGNTGSLRRRRGIIALSMAGMAAMGPVSLLRSDERQMTPTCRSHEGGSILANA